MDKPQEIFNKIENTGCSAITTTTTKVQEYLKIIDECCYIDIVNEQTNKVFLKNIRIALKDIYPTKNNDFLIMAHRTGLYFSWITILRKNIIKIKSEISTNNMNKKYNIIEPKNVFEMIKKFKESVQMLIKHDGNNLLDEIIKYFKQTKEDTLIQLYKNMIEVINQFNEMENESLEIQRTNAEKYFNSIKLVMTQFNNDFEKVKILKISQALISMEECSTFIKRKIEEDKNNEDTFIRVSSFLFLQLFKRDISSVLEKKTIFYWKWLTQFYNILNQYGLSGGNNIKKLEYNINDDNNIISIISTFLQSCSILQGYDEMCFILQGYDENDIKNGIIAYFNLKFDNQYIKIKEKEIYIIIEIINGFRNDTYRVQKGMFDKTLL
jgi:hypothetical protein